MNIAYLANIRIPTEKAHGLQIMKTCEALAERGARVILYVPSRRNPINADPFGFFAVRRVFSIVTIPVPECRVLGRLGYLLHTFLFAWKARAAMCRETDVHVYSRDHLVLAVCSWAGLRAPFYYESHSGTWNTFARYVVAHARRVVCITEGLKQMYVSRGVSSHKIIVAPDAVDSTLFDTVTDQEQCRRECGLPLDKKIVLYAGSFSLYAWKGLDIFLEAAAQADDAYLFVAVGGTSDDVDRLSRQQYPRVRLFERVAPTVVPRFMRAADVVVLPNKAGTVVSERYTSPMKLFEYMASGVPLVASDIPSVREVVSEDSAILVTPNDPAALLAGIQRALEDRSGSVARAERARAEVREHYSWSCRAETIVRALNNT